MLMKKNNQRKKILILGGSGFIGRATAIHLSKMKEDVTITYRTENNSHFNDGFKIKKIKYDVLDKNDDINDLVKNYDIIINFIALVNSHSLQSNKTDREINVSLVKKLLSAVAKFNPRCKILFTSSQTVYGATNSINISEDHPIVPETVYAKQKREAEIICEYYKKNYNISVTILRLANVYGFGSKTNQSVISSFINNALEGKEIRIFGEGKELRDYIYIGDVIKAISLAINPDLKSMTDNCGSGKYYSVKKIALSIINNIGSGKIVHVPFPNQYAKYPGDIILISNNFMNETNWKPQVSLEEGLEKMFNYYKLHKAKYIPKE